MSLKNLIKKLLGNKENQDTGLQENKHYSSFNEFYEDTLQKKYMPLFRDPITGGIRGLEMAIWMIRDAQEVYGLLTAEEANQMIEGAKAEMPPNEYENLVLERLGQ